MFNLGPMEIGGLVVLSLLIFGPRKLPEMGKAIGSAITEFRASMSGGGGAPKKEEAKAIPDDSGAPKDNTPTG